MSVSAQIHMQRILPSNITVSTYFIHSYSTIQHSFFPGFLPTTLLKHFYILYHIKTSIFWNTYKIISSKYKKVMHVSTDCKASFQKCLQLTVKTYFYTNKA